jgi:hypothetical protein
VVSGWLVGGWGVCVRGSRRPASASPSALGEARVSSS